MSKTVCFDVDGVIADIAGGINLSLERLGIEDYDYAHWLVGVFEDDLSSRVFGDVLFWKNLKPFVSSWYAVNELWGRGFDVVFVTGRYSDVSRKCLLPWLDSWKFQYSNVVFCDIGSKLDVVLDLGGEFLVEDNPYEVRSVVDGGCRGVLMRSWYNREFWDVFESVGSLLDLKV